MRLAAAFVLVSISALLLPCAAPAASPVSELVAEPSTEPAVTVVMNFRGNYSARVIVEMQKESAHILGETGLRIGWISAPEAEGQSFRELVVMTFKGSCVFQPAPAHYDEPGAYASTLTTDGIVQPFGEVDCDHVARTARSAMTSGDDYARADILTGRALGRVVAHELVHMLTHSDQHGHEGVQKAALTGRQLIEASLLLSREDVDRLRLELKSH